LIQDSSLVWQREQMQAASSVSLFNVGINAAFQGSQRSGHGVLKPAARTFESGPTSILTLPG